MTVAVPVITVFGSSRAARGSAEYDAAFRLGRLLGLRGWTLCNGGHEGTMEAAARGAKEAGGNTVGVSIAEYRPTNRNAWLDEEIVAETLFARLEQLTTLGDAFVVLRGGIGTLLELTLAWNLCQRTEFARKPLIIVGTEWSRVIETLREQLPMHAWESASVTLVRAVDDAVDQLARHFASSSSPEA